MKYLSNIIGTLYLLSILAIVWLKILGLVQLDLFSSVCLVFFLFIGVSYVGVNFESNNTGQSEKDM